MSGLKVLNLYAGIGGNRRLWEGCEVTAVEYSSEIAKVYAQLHPQDTVVVGDAVVYLEKHYAAFDFIWASPPCTAFSVASIDVSSAMILAHVIDLGEVVLKQSGHEAHHAGIGSARCSIEHQRLNPKPGLLS